MKFSLTLLSLLGSLALCHADAVKLQINGPDGKPIAGAQVRIVESKGAWYQRDWLPTIDKVSDANGVVTLESKGKLIVEGDTQFPPDLTKATMQARVLAPGMAATSIELHAGDNSLALATGGSYEGITLGEDEKPVANAHLLVTAFPSKGNGYFMLPDVLAIEAVSDAQGHWKFESMPLSGKVRIEVRDARFKNETFLLDAEQKAPPLFLSPGVTIKGRMLKPDGTGAAGVKIYAGDYNNQPVTNGNGRFQATGLSESNVMLQIVERDQKLPFIIDYKSVENLKAGEVRDIGDWKTKKGVNMKGRVVDAVTKKPIADASVSTWGHGPGAYGQSDKLGGFDVLVSPDSSNFSVSASGFTSVSGRDVPDAKNGVIDVGAIELRVAPKIEGVVLDEEGNAVSGIRLYASGKNGNRSYAYISTTDGKFSFDSLEAGIYTLHPVGYEMASEPKFTIVAGKAQTLKVVLKGNVGAIAQKQSSVEGRVVDGEGTPIAGAKVTLRVQTQGGGTSGTFVVSQSDGSFKTTVSSGQSLKVIGLTRPGFARGQETIAEKDGNWHVDITLQKRGTALRGRVVDATGKVVKGAFVGVQNNNDVPVATDENGAFALVDTPMAGITLLASDGPSLASFEVKKAGEAIEIKLPASEPIADKAALADQILATASLGYDWEEKWEALGTQRIEANLMKQDEWRRGEFLRELSKREPKTLLAHEAELRAATQSDDLPELERLVMLAKAGSSDATQKQQAQAWLRAQEKEKRDISSDTVTRLLGLAEVGYQFSEQEGEMWLDYAGQIAEQVGKKNVGDYSWDWGNLIGRIGPKSIEALSEGWSSTAQMQLLSPAMGAWSKDGNIEFTKWGWERMQKLAVDATQHPDPNVKVEGFRQKPDDLLNQGRDYYAQALANTNPKAALVLTESLPEFQKVESLLKIAHSAVKLKQLDVAREAINAVFEVKLGNTEFVAEGAGLAQEFDATFAADLWTKAFAKARIKNEDDNMGWQPSIAAYAQRSAKYWPGRSRILIEREWPKRVAQLTKPGDEDGMLDSNGRALQALAVAMGYVAPRRALEIAEKVPTRENLRAEARGDIAIALLAP